MTNWQLTIGSFKVPIIYTINGFIIYFIIQNGVVQEIKNGVINGLFSINGLKGSFFIKCPLSFSFCVPSTRPLLFRVWNHSKLCFVFCFLWHSTWMDMWHVMVADVSCWLSSTSFTLDCLPPHISLVAPQTLLLMTCRLPTLFQPMPCLNSCHANATHDVHNPGSFLYVTIWVCRWQTSLFSLLLFSLSLLTLHLVSCLALLRGRQHQPSSLSLFLCGSDSWASKQPIINWANGPLFCL